MLPNATAMPLLMLQALKSTGLLDELTLDGESVDSALNRGKNFILINSVIQQTVAFAVGPSVLKMDGRHDTSDIHGPDDVTQVQVIANHSEIVDERSRLLIDGNANPSDPPEDSVAPDKPQKLTRLAKLLIFLKHVGQKMNRWLNPPLYGAFLAFFFGVCHQTDLLMTTADLPIAAHPAATSHFFGPRWYSVPFDNAIN